MQAIDLLEGTAAPHYRAEAHQVLAVVEERAGNPAAALAALWEGIGAVDTGAAVVARSTTDTGAEVRRLEARCRALEQLVHRSEAERRQVVSRLLRAEQQERRRIASELHDDTVQVLAASLLALDRLAGCTDADAIRGVADSTRQTLAAATERTRRLMFELRPPQGLAKAVRELASHAGREADLDVTVSVPPEPVPFMVEEVAYRTVREAVSNVRRHAQARHLEIAIAVSGGMLRGSVRDDGRGFDVVPRSGAGHTACACTSASRRCSSGPSWRAAEATVDSTPGKGTEVTFEVPMSGVPDRRRLGHVAGAASARRRAARGRGR